MTLGVFLYPHLLLFSFLNYNPEHAGATVDMRARLILYRKIPLDSEEVLPADLPRFHADSPLPGP